MSQHKDSTRKPVLHVVHCIDTEGPLTEPLEATFERVNSVFGLSLAPSQETLGKLQRQELPLGGCEAEVARMVAPALLKYNNSWDEIDAMLDEAMSASFRGSMADDTGRGWVYSWHCMDHAGYASNPRMKDMGYGSVFRFYKNKIAATKSTCDEINWHFHPLSFSRNPLQAATSYVNSYDVLMQVLCRRLIDEAWYPLVNRPGFHSERPDSHAFLEQWIPYDYASQSGGGETGQPDLSGGRFGDWRRAPQSWQGYHPHHDDYQRPGQCRRWIFRCLNVGTRFKPLTREHVREAFAEARREGSAILAFCNHDYRDIRPDVQSVRQMLREVKPEFTDVEMRFSGALEAARAHTQRHDAAPPVPLRLALAQENGRVSVRVTAGQLFGPQPFLALKSKAGTYHHDNFDVQEPGKHYSYVLDGQTLPLSDVAVIAAGAAGMDGSADVQLLKVA